MSTSAPSAPVAAPAPPVAAPISARPPTPVNPTSQTRPTPPAAMKPPTTRRPPPTAAPDPSKAPPPMDAVSPTLKDGIKKLFSSDSPEAVVPPAAPAAVVPVPDKPKELVAVAAPVEAPKPEKGVEPPKASDVPAASSSDDVYSDSEAPKDMSPTSVSHWEKAKQRAQHKLFLKEQELLDARAQLDIFKKATPAETADVEKLKTELRAAQDELAVYNVQRHPDFVNQYTRPKENALAEAREVLNYSGKEQGDLGALLEKPQKDFNAEVAKLTEGMNQVDASVVINGLRSAYKIARDEKTALSQAGELRAGLEAKSAAQSKQAFEEAYRGMDVDKLTVPFEIPTGITAEARAEIEAANAELATLRSRAESNAFGKLTPKSAASLAVKAALFDQAIKVRFPLFQKGIEALKSQNQALLAELNAIRAAKAPGSFTAPAAEPVTQMAWEDKKKDLLAKAFGPKSKA